ncbi:hypothetical protein ABB37_04828 [Leptomonas pyrrhocoris]|uniref:Uncharacterized protein n=1 Tax=Leptomonas pyrrhocoris TaxID=157538 RepID=A0A0M9G1S0_LEPPY|nr:hypothetical protein ABB37_04828 [Leptomonas pyrrhocoris]KPA80640.1 hypothetical protein ABB37_04828 [Leptomonas pyrrhocoris]|eukprot:XP_015659079.1 hypothetical protein ABB37_04828 [Leptomonas pyrrhocoris]
MRMDVHLFLLLPDRFRSGLLIRVMFPSTITTPVVHHFFLLLLFYFSCVLSTTSLSFLRKDTSSFYGLLYLLAFVSYCFSVLNENKMNMQSTSRGIEDLLYNLGSSLERFKGVNGLQRLVTTGKLSLLSLFGEFERTRDEVYEKRSAAVNETRRCLIQIADEFEGITGTAQKLVHKIDHLLNTLVCFHRACDMELDDRSTTDDSDAQQLLRDFAQMQEKNNKLKTSLNDFCTSTSTCADLTRSAVAQLGEMDTSTSYEVSVALTDFDRQRRRVQVRRNEFTNAMSSASSRQDPVVQFAEFNYLKESDALEGYGRRYIDSLAAAMTTTAFALEQSSMTGWASSNVFFVQLGLFFHDMTEGSRSVAVNLLSVKNAQKVSRQLTDEKRTLLQQQRTAARDSTTQEREDVHYEIGGVAYSTTMTASRATPTSSNASPRQSPMHVDSNSHVTQDPVHPQTSSTFSTSTPAVSKSVDLSDLFQ